MTTNTNVPAVIEKSKMKPKPRKSEILSAMVEIRVQEMKAENAIKQKKRDALRKKIEKRILQIAKQQFASKARVSGHGGVNRQTGKAYGVYVEIGSSYSCDESKRLEIPPDLEALIKEEDEINTPFIEPKQIRKELQRKMELSSSDRVQAMVADPVTRKALSALYNQLTSTSVESTTTTAPAIPV